MECPFERESVGLRAVFGKVIIGKYVYEFAGVNSFVGMVVGELSNQTPREGYNYHSHVQVSYKLRSATE